MDERDVIDTVVTGDLQLSYGLSVGTLGRILTEPGSLGKLTLYTCTSILSDQDGRRWIKNFHSPDYDYTEFNTGVI